MPVRPTESAPPVHNAVHNVLARRGMVPKTLHDWNRVVGGGIAAGLIGGVVLGLVLAAGSLAMGQDVWMSMKGAGAPFLGGRALAPGFDALAVFVGVVAHLAVSVAWAVPFVLLADGLSRGATVVSGALWGIVVWIGMHYAVLPMLGLSQMANSAPPTLSALLHVFFGFVVALGYLPFQHPRRARPLVEAH